MLTYHDPRAPTATAVMPYELGIDLRGSNQVTIGFLANGFPDSENFIAAVASAMQKRLPAMTPLFWNKGNASITVPEAMLGEIEERCQALVAAYGH